MWYTKKQVQELFDISHTTVDRWMKSGKLKYYKTGNSRSNGVRFAKNDILKLLDDMKR